MKKRKLWGKIFLGLVILGILALMIADKVVISFAEERVFEEVDEVPENRVALLLGTSKYVPDGRLNLFYLYRIEAAVELYSSGKVEFILISGDNSVEHYNEPETMRDDLVAEGVPFEKIYLDYAGFRTLDSVVRAKEIFGLESFTVVSQQFHNERAIFLGSFYDLDIVGYNAQDVAAVRSLRVVLREKLARLYMMFDLLRGTDPKFLGETIEIN